MVNPAVKEPLAYNLAQFNSVEVLTEAFHQVQDRVLASDEVPLVIFDEFDASFDGVLGWLKYFLAPMQDGRFRGKSGEYRVGRSIFLFAGGTSTTFEEFTKGPGAVASDLKTAKLPDFISRLKGYLGVLDINPSGHYHEPRHQEILRKVRRAMILRSLLVQHARSIIQPGPEGREGIAGIHDTVIDAFLDVTRYQHGLRSMAAIVETSRRIGTRLMPASMPSTAQLEMHAPGFGALLE